MASDFDKEEIQDSAFPVDFNDDTNSLDMYGVWVKSGPRDADLSDVGETALSRGIDGLTDMDSFDDISGLPDLPDFDDSTEKTAVLSDDSEDITLSEEDFAVGTDSETPLTGSADLPDMDYLSINFDEQSNTESGMNKAEDSQKSGFLADTENEAVAVGNGILDNPADIDWPTDESASDFADVSLSSSQVEGGETWDETTEIVFDDSAIELNTEPEKDIFATQKSDVEMAETSENIDDSEEISLDMFESDVSSIESESVEEPQNDISGDLLKDIEFEDVNAHSEWVDLSAHEETDSSSRAMEEAIEASMQDETTAELAMDESTLLSEGDLQATFSPTETEKLPSDDDFSSFLDDLNATEPKTGGAHFAASSEVDLDSFIDQFNETGGRTEAETEKLFDDTDPVDLDLDFDEDFLADAQMIKETGSSVSESEFMSSEFGVEMIDETPKMGTDDDFADILQSAGLSDESTTLNTIAERSASIQETDEFDDLLSSLDKAPAPAQTVVPAQKAIPTPKTFDLSVSDEDGSGPIVAPAAESSPEDFDVALFGVDSPVEKTDTPLEASDEQEILVSDDLKDYNNTEIIPSTDEFFTEPGEVDVSLDFDDLSAVEKDLSDITPETGDTDLDRSDKSTELLMHIADELSSIKKELSVLKSELAGLRTTQPVTVPVEAKQDDEQTTSGGFFNDDDPDEAIALTGDELNNILITADFTEEKIDSTDDSTLQIGNSIEALSSDIKNKALSDDEYEVPDTLPDSIFDIPDIAGPTPIEVSHVNTVDDDMSYLEESDVLGSDMDDVAIEEPEMEIIDFNDEKLEEPELTEFNINLDELESHFPSEQEIAKGDTLNIEDETNNFADFSDFGAISDEKTVFEEDLSIPEENPETDTVIQMEPEYSDVVEQYDSAKEFEQSIAQFQDETAITNESEPEASLDSSPQPVFSPEEPLMKETGVQSLPIELKDEIKSVLSYMDQLLESLPEDKIEEFARSEHFSVYRKLFEELGIS